MDPLVSGNPVVAIPTLTVSQFQNLPAGAPSNLGRTPLISTGNPRATGPDRSISVGVGEGRDQRAAEPIPQVRVGYPRDFLEGSFNNEPAPSPLASLNGYNPDLFAGLRKNSVELGLDFAGVEDLEGFCVGDSNRIIVRPDGSVAYCKPRLDKPVFNKAGEPVYPHRRPRYPERLQVDKDGRPIFPEPVFNDTEAEEPAPTPAATPAPATPSLTPAPAKPAAPLREPTAPKIPCSMKKLVNPSRVNSADLRRFRQLFIHKLVSLHSAGFKNTPRNLRLLIKYRGDIDEVMAILEGSEYECPDPALAPTAQETAAASAPPSPLTLGETVDIMDQGFD